MQRSAGPGKTKEATPETDGTAGNFWFLFDHGAVLVNAHHSNRTDSATKSWPDSIVVSHSIIQAIYEGQNSMRIRINSKIIRFCLTLNSFFPKEKIQQHADLYRGDELFGIGRLIIGMINFSPPRKKPNSPFEPSGPSIKPEISLTESFRTEIPSTSTSTSPIWTIPVV